MKYCVNCELLKKTTISGSPFMQGPHTQPQLDSVELPFIWGRRGCGEVSNYATVRLNLSIVFIFS